MVAKLALDDLPKSVRHLVNALHTSTSRRRRGPPGQAELPESGAYLNPKGM